MTDQTDLIVENTPPHGAQRRTPNGNWTLIGMYPQYTAYQRGHFCALSSLVNVYDEHQPTHWEWLISFSKMGMARLSIMEVQQCLADFDALDFMEDNHEPASPGSSGSRSRKSTAFRAHARTRRSSCKAITCIR